MIRSLFVSVLTVKQANLLLLQAALVHSLLHSGAVQLAYLVRLCSPFYTHLNYLTTDRNSPV